ncbi:MAG: hypothetical protein MZV64_28490 [Ignavibacteriales bacterium]|nr:hypothetical protein [Ignavibacteriales bacterium]
MTLIRILAADADGLLRGQNFRAEPSGLRAGPLREIGPRDPVREAEVSFRSGSCVPACPPGAFCSIRTVFKPSDAAYTAFASPAGPPPMTATS